MRALLMYPILVTLFFTQAAAAQVPSPPGRRSRRARSSLTPGSRWPARSAPVDFVMQGEVVHKSPEVPEQRISLLRGR